MNDDVTEVLREIAGLLRQRVELEQQAQQREEERDRRSIEKMSHMMDAFKSGFPKFDMPASDLERYEPGASASE